MPWLYNPTRDTHPVTLQDGTPYGFLPRQKVYVDPSNMSAAAWQLVYAGLLVNRGGDPVVEEVKKEITVQPVEVASAVEDCPVVAEVNSVGIEQAVEALSTESSVVLEVVHGLVSDHSADVLDYTSSDHQDNDASVLIASPADLDGEKDEKAIEKQADELEKQDDSRELDQDSSLEGSRKLMERRQRKFRKNK